MKIFNNKKGTLDETFNVIGWIFALIIVVTLTVIVINEFNNKIQTHPNATLQAKETVNKLDTKIPASWNWGILIVYLTFFVITILAATKAPESPILIVVTIIFMVLIVFAAMIITNVYDEMKDKSIKFKNAAEEMNISDFILDNLVYIILAHTLLVGIVLHGRLE